MSFIELSNASKLYHAGSEEYPALRSVSLAIESGEFVSVMGPSGSGKSTLLALLGGLSKPSSGTVSVDGIDLGSLGPARLADFRREYLGFVFQSFYLVPYLTALQNVMVPLAVQPGMNGRMREAATEALRVVGLETRAGRLPSQLSGGEQERVAIARAIVNKPSLIWRTGPPATSIQRPGTRCLTCWKDCTQGDIPS
jgi:putative ABC transport system ATP-binding protein